MDLRTALQQCNVSIGETIGLRFHSKQVFNRAPIWISKVIPLETVEIAVLPSAFVLSLVSLLGKDNSRHVLTLHTNPIHIQIPTAEGVNWLEGKEQKTITVPGGTRTAHVEQIGFILSESSYKAFVRLKSPPRELNEDTVDVVQSVELECEVFSL
jgi:hypothetical protein